MHASVVAVCTSLSTSADRRGVDGGHGGHAGRERAAVRGRKRVELPRMAQRARRVPRVLRRKDLPARVQLRRYALFASLPSWAQGGMGHAPVRLVCLALQKRRCWTPQVVFLAAGIGYSMHSR